MSPSRPSWARWRSTAVGHLLAGRLALRIAHRLDAAGAGRSARRLTSSPAPDPRGGAAQAGTRLSESRETLRRSRPSGEPDRRDFEARPRRAGLDRMRALDKDRTRRTRRPPASPRHSALSARRAGRGRPAIDGLHSCAKRWRRHRAALMRTGAFACYTFRHRARCLLVIATLGPSEW